MARRASARGRGIGHPVSRGMPIRQIHAYLSVFVAPTILFFAFTGTLQLFSLHEAHGDYRPAPLIEGLAALHKDQRFAVKPSRPPSALRTPVTGAEGDWVAPVVKAAPRAKEAPNPRELALKALFCAAAVMLIVSTLLGVWMAVTQNRRKLVLLLLLVLGAAAPVGILLLP